MKKIFTFILGITLSLSISAANWTVNNLEAIYAEPSTTEGSLSYCIENAEDGDIITFEASLSGKTIQFYAPIKIMKTLTIDASALSSPIAFDGQNATTIAQLSDYDTRFTNDVTATFNNIIFKQGYTSKAGEAAGVNVFSKKSYFNNCQFLNNISTETGTNRQPGAIRNSNSRSFMYITGCVFRGNQTARKGGAIAIDAPTVYIDKCLFDSNKAGDNGAAIDTKDGTIGGDNTSPVLDIRNTTFVNNTCSYTKKNDGMVIFNGQSSSPLPMRLINCTFVNNKNENQSDVSTVYSTKYNIEITGCLFGGNKMFKSGGEQYANDVRVGATPGVLTSYGYNIFYGLQYASGEDPSLATDTQYREWTAAPFVESTVNAEGVLTPTSEDADLWKTLKTIPIGHLETVLGSSPKDQRGVERTSKLGYIGAYEYPSFVLEIEDDQFGSTPGSGEMHLYKASEKAILNNNSSGFVSWLIEGNNHTDIPFELTMDQDYYVVANYTPLVGINESNRNNSNIYVNNNTLYINGHNLAAVKIYSVQGSLIETNIIAADSYSKNIDTLPQGIYIVVASDIDGNITKQKISK